MLILKSYLRTGFTKIIFSLNGTGIKIVENAVLTLTLRQKYQLS